MPRPQDLIPDSADLVPSAGARPLVGQIAQDAALAALLGGNLFGRIAMHPALADVGDKAERGKVLNRAWRRYGNVNSLSLVALVGGWLACRDAEHGRLRTSRRRRRLIRAKDVAVGAVAVTGLASAVSGVGFSQQAPEGAVPMDSGSEPAAETPPRAATLKRAVNVLGGLNLAAEASLLIVDALLARGA
ncbi:MAG: hypothetical protein JOZ07_17050 [Solirubrobacterales bacterium]|nr:hypothetical protein [Solirubrobacterales bacterium]